MSRPPPPPNSPSSIPKTFIYIHILTQPTQTWLHPVRELRRKHKSELSRLPTDDARATRVAELNVQASLDVLRQHPAIKRAISERGLSLHGLIYDIGAGELRITSDAVGGKKGTGLWSPS